MGRDGPSAAGGIRVVSIADADYPGWLRRTHEPPVRLWVRGRLVADEGERSVAIVGARAATPLGAAFTRTLARDLAAAGLTIVSGLARGIDTAAHAGALAAGGRTVAVLGSGIDVVYPRENASLADAIAAAGLLASQYPPGTAPQPFHFPRRNATIAGWSRLVVVVEAGEKSGALITARLALDEGREVMAVPGHPSQPCSAGTNALLRDGAALVRDAGDVLAELGLPARPVVPPPAADPVLACFRPGVPCGVDELAGRAGCPLPALLSRLSQLELSGALRRLPGGLFVRS
jgi:DNA processing protein